MKKIHKKFTAILMLIMVLINIIQPIVLARDNEFSGSGVDHFIARQYATKLKTTDERNGGENGIIARRLLPQSKNWDFSQGDGILVFCAENGVSYETGSYYEASYTKPITDVLKEAAKVAYFGWYQPKGNYGADGLIDTPSLKQYAFTQQMIWEVLGQSSATFVEPAIQSEYIAFKNEINSKITSMKQKPSFSGTTIKLDVGENRILTDDNGVLSDYCNLDKTINGIKITHTKGENTMTINVTEECNIEKYNISEEIFKEWGMVKELSKDNNTTIYFTFSEGIQNQIYSMNYNDEVSLSLNLSIQSFGKLELEKHGENGELLNGAKFSIEGPSAYKKEVTVTGGKIILDNLKAGTYYIKELQAPSGYLLDTKTYQVEIKVGQTTKQVISNSKPTGSFTLTKTNADKSAGIKGVKYRVWNDEGYDNVHETDSNGKIQINNLKLGKYYYQEIETVNGYLIDNEIYSFTLKYLDQNTAVVSASDEKINNEPTRKNKTFKNG